MAIEHPAAPRLRSDRLELALPSVADKFDLFAFHQRNHAFFKPWLPRPSGNLRDPEFWSAWIDLSQRLYAADAAVHLVIRAREAGNIIIGQVDYSAIARGPLNTAMLGFQLDEQFQGRGLMREAVALSLEFMFRRRKVHRIVAAYIRENEKSARLLSTLGFREEGIARSFLEIDGSRCDHVFVAKLSTDAS